MIAYNGVHFIRTYEYCTYVSKMADKTVVMPLGFSLAVALAVEQGLIPFIIIPVVSPNSSERASSRTIFSLTYMRTFVLYYYTESCSNILLLQDYNIWYSSTRTYYYIVLQKSLFLGIVKLAFFVILHTTTSKGKNILFPLILRLLSFLPSFLRP